MIYLEKKIEIDYSKISAPDTGHAATLKVFIPNTEDEVSKFTPKRPTVLILPGGGYHFTSEREAEPIAMNYLAQGINACILYYSVAPAVYPTALIQTLSAIKYIRENAATWFADPDKIYVCGFSAGGHLAASAGTLWNKDEAKVYFENPEEAKPNGLVLAYPVIVNDEHFHGGSFINLLGEKANDEEMRHLTCLDKQVDKDTPPAFIWSTFGDKAVPCENSMRFASALRAQNIPFELHIYEKGEHGLATCDDVTNSFAHIRQKDWMYHSAEWMKDTRYGK